ARTSSMSPNVPSMPYVGISPLRRKSPSVAPVLITGTTMAPGNISLVSDSTAAMTSGRSGDGLLGLASPTNDTVIFGSASTSTSASRTECGGTPGRMRQFTLAVASCGNALVAWPPDNIVATQVVRIIEFQYGSCADSRDAAARSGVGFATARMSAATFGSDSTAADRSK